MAEARKFKLIIAGGREFDNRMLLSQKVNRALVNKINEGYQIEVVCGGARGADTLGEELAIAQGWSVKRFPAQWDKYGKRAGFLRNEEMAKYADALMAFWDGDSRGTQHMIATAEQYKLAIKVIRY